MKKRQRRRPSLCPNKSLSLSLSLFLVLSFSHWDSTPANDAQQSSWIYDSAPLAPTHTLSFPLNWSLSLSISALLDFIFFLFFITRGSAHQRGQAKQSWPASKLPPRIRCLSFSYFEFSPFSLVFICSPSLLVALTEIYEVSLDLLVSNVLVPVLTGLI